MRPPDQPGERAASGTAGCGLEVSRRYGFSGFEMRPPPGGSESSSYAVGLGVRVGGSCCNASGLSRPMTCSGSLGVMLVFGFGFSLVAGFCI